MNQTNDLWQVYDAKYDFLKFFLSILVIAIHAQLYPLVLYPWLRIAVPLFFIMSSYFLFSKLQAATPNEQIDILKKYVFRNIKLYCFWFIILLPITLYVRRKLYFSDGIATGLLNFLRSLFFGSTFMLSWYITASIIGVIIIFLFSRKLKHGTVLFITVFTFCVVTLCSSYEHFFNEIEFFQRLASCYRFVFGNPALSFPASLFWIFIGKSFAEKRIKFPSNWISIIILGISCVGLFLEWHLVRQLNGTYDNDSYFMLLPTCISLFGCIQTINPINSKYAHFFRKASTIIYVVHGSIIPVMGFFLRKILHLDSALLLFTLTFICSVIVYFCIEYMICHFSDNKFGKLLKNAY